MACRTCYGRGWIQVADDSPLPAKKTKKQGDPLGFIMFVVFVFALMLVGALGGASLEYAGVKLDTYGPWERLGMTFAVGIAEVTAAVVLIYLALRWLKSQVVKLWQRVFRKR
ncbi:hypothetical protein D9M68_453270 [compost metagenome]